MLGPIKSTIHGVVDFTWPMLIISIVIMVSVRLTYLIKNKQKIVFYKEIIMLCFAIYILCLFQVVTSQDDIVSWSSNNFIPFKEIMRYNITSRLFLKNVLGNMIMFLPFGFFLGFYLKLDKPKLNILLTLIASFAIETVQMCIGRVFDVDDIILNVLGGLIGYYIYILFRKIWVKYKKAIHNEMFLNIVAFIGLIMLMLILI